MTEENIEIQNETEKTNLQFWVIPCIVVTAIAAFWRFWDLAMKPLHHDEGVNGYFLINLFREGIYKYDPSNYHGPTLYYISLAFTKVFGLETFPIRASMAIFGVLMVAMVLCLRKYLGTLGSILAALFVALSPGMVFISRYFIHEIFFVFCSLGIVLGILFFIEGRKAGIFSTILMTLLLLVCFVPPAIVLANIIGKENPTLLWILQIGFFAIEAFLVFLVMRMLLSWNDGRPIYLMLASASTALFFATKETAFITIGTMLIACVCVWIWLKIYGGVFGEPKSNELEPLKLNWDTFLQRFRDSDAKLLSLAVVITFVYVSVIFFSSFFTYWEGVIGAFKAYAFWTKTGTTDHTQSGFLGYAKWLVKLEAPILLLSAVGTIIAFAKGRHIFAMFTGLWAFGLFLAYSIIPYKTPWLALSFILPMAMIAGYGINEIFNNRDIAFKALAGLLMIFAIGVLSYQTYDLNFERYDDDSMPYVYAHTQRGFLDMIKKIEYYAEKSELDKNASIEIVSPEYWPMPWYMRNYPKAVFHGRIIDANTAEMIVAKKVDQDDEIFDKYSRHYKKAGEFPLRPGVTLILLVRKDLADADASNITPNLY